MHPDAQRSDNDGSTFYPDDLPMFAPPPSTSENAGHTPAGRHDQLLTMLRRPLPWRIWRILAAVAVLLVIVFTAGWFIGARDPLLAPVRITAVDPSVGLSVPERVYATAKNAVVTVSVPGGGTGSAFFYRPTRLVTNEHVLATSPTIIKELALGGHPQVDILLTDGRTRHATVFATDTRLDIALLTVDGPLGITPLSFADSTTAVPGEPTVVIGAPFGMATSVSSGIISGFDHSSQFATDPAQNTLIATDAAVNPGNSGGPLLDQTAGVIGIVTLRPDQVGGRNSDGIAFAIPSALVAPAIDELERTGKVSHPILGISVASPTPDQPTQTGIGVVAVTKNSSAAAAGLRVGDELRTIDGQELHAVTDLYAVLAGKTDGTKVTVTGLRHGTQFTATVTLTERPMN